MNEVKENNIRIGNLVQIGAIVNDLDATVKAFSEILGLGPFRFVEWPPDRPDIISTYYNEPGKFKFREALIQIGSIELELIQPLEGDNIYSDFLNEHGQGLHHLRFDVNDPEEFIKKMRHFDIEVIQSGSGTRLDTTWAYLGTENIFGFTVELMNKTPSSGPNYPSPTGEK